MITVTFEAEPVMSAHGKSEWRLHLPFVAVVEDGQASERITIPAGFVTDLATVPRLPGMFLIFGGRARRSAILHDYLYSDLKRDREWCDAVFYAAMRGEESWWRRALMWLGVRVGGGFFRRSAQ